MRVNRRLQRRRAAGGIKAAPHGVGVITLTGENLLYGGFVAQVGCRSRLAGIAFDCRDGNGQEDKENE